MAVAGDVAVNSATVLSIDAAPRLRVLPSRAAFILHAHDPRGDFREVVIVRQDVDVLRAAIAAARGPAFVGRFRAGVLEREGGQRVAVFVDCVRGGAVLGLGVVVNDAPVAFMTFANDEVDDLERALDSITTVAGVAPKTRRIVSSK